MSENVYKIVLRHHYGLADKMSFFGIGTCAIGAKNVEWKFIYTKRQIAEYAVQEAIYANTNILASTCTIEAKPRQLYLEYGVCSYIKFRWHTYPKSIDGTRNGQRNDLAENMPLQRRHTNIEESNIHVSKDKSHQNLLS